MESTAVKRVFKRMLRRYGYDVVSYDPVNHPVARRARLMSQHKIDLVFDVGANIGQYAMQIRETGYAGSIISFEPLSSAFAELAVRASADRLWQAVNIGLGNRDGEAQINIAKNSQSSSILGMLPSHTLATPEAAYIGHEQIVVRRIDSICEKYWRPANKLFLKIDAQGYEKTIIDGAENSLDKILGIQMELSLVPLYEGETLLADMINFMGGREFVLMSIEPTYGSYETGQMLQADCLFFRQY